MWSPDLYLESLYQECVNQHSTTYNADGQTSMKEKVRKSLGNFKDNKEPLNPVLLEKSDMGTYWRHRVEITTIHPLRMPVYVLIPKSKNNGKFQAVIGIHGHGYGSKEAVGLNPDYSARTEEGYHKEFAVELVKKGFVAVVPELVGFGGRKLQADQGKGLPTDNSCYMIASQLLLVGKNLTRIAGSGIQTRHRFRANTGLCGRKPYWMYGYFRRRPSCCIYFHS